MHDGGRGGYTLQDGTATTATHRGHDDAEATSAAAPNHLNGRRSRAGQAEAGRGMAGAAGQGGARGGAGRGSGVYALQSGGNGDPAGLARICDAQSAGRGTH